MTQTRDIIVVGGGIGGLAAACALAQAGRHVTLLEQAEAIKEVGAGLQISPNGMRVLRQLGLGPAITAISQKGAAVSLRRAESDMEVAHLDLSKLGADTAYHFVHRADLIDCLLRAAKAAGVQVRLLQKVHSITPGSPATVTTQAGATFEAAMVIDASGLHASLRARLNGPANPFFTGQVAWRAIVPNRHDRGPEVQVHMAPGGHVVSYPLRDGRAINLVAVQERRLWAEEGWSHRDEPVAVQQAFASAAPAVSDLLAQIDTVHLWGLFRHPVAETWTGPGCALLGDAAHPTLPFLAQGANMALEDAWALAALLTSNRSQTEALQAYQSLRRPRAAKVIEAASKNAWRYHLRHGPVRFAGHVGLKMVSTLAPNAMLAPFRWIYDYDVVKDVAAL